MDMADSADLSSAQSAAVPAHELLGYEDIECTAESLTGTALVLKQGTLFLLTNGSGDVTPPGTCELGLFADDTRVLSHYELTTAAGPPDVLSSQAARVFASQIDLTVTDVQFGGLFSEPKNFMHIRREQLLDGYMTDRLLLTNFMDHTVDFWIELSFAADYADIFEVRGATRDRRGTYYRPVVGERDVVWSYRGLDDRLRRTVLRFSRPPDELEERRARWNMQLRPKDAVELEAQIIPLFDDEPVPPPSAPYAQRFHGNRVAYERWRDENAEFTTNDEFFNAAVRQSITDLHALMIEYGGLPVMTAGIPWFTTPFGRDSIITSLQALVFNPEIAVQTLRFLAAFQGERVDEFTEEEPGKILHEVRRGEMAACREVPHLPYYGSVDATPLFLVLLGETLRWTGDVALARELLPHAERALRWIDEYGDLDGDGFVEYARRSPRGLFNQGWKDSDDGVPFPDGTIPQPPIALVEVQGYVYAARMAMAEVYATLGDPERSAGLREQADALRHRIQEVFWVEELDYFALALDAEKRRLPTLTSNPGHLLWSGVPTPEQARSMAAILLGEDMFSGWGIRTLARHQPVYNPLSYHDGTIWPHDNSLIALGLARYGFRAEAAAVLIALYEASLYFRYQRLPELFCGISRGETDAPVHYPVSCSPQAWASGVFFPMLQGMLGIQPDATAGQLRLIGPYLPAKLRFLDIFRMRIGGSRVSLQFNRQNDRTMANVVAIEGEPIQIRIEVA